MNPEEKAVLENLLKISEENNSILKQMRSAQKRATIYGFIKLLVIVIPFVLGYLFLQPYIDLATQNYQSFQDLLK